MTHEEARLSWYVGAAVALTLLLVQAGEMTTLDGADMLAVAHSLIHHGTLQVPGQNGVAGVGGAYYAKFGIGLSALIVPFVVIGDLLALLLGHQPRLESLMAASTTPLIMGALAMTRWRGCSKGRRPEGLGRGGGGSGQCWRVGDPRRGGGGP